MDNEGNSSTNTSDEFILRNEINELIMKIKNAGDKSKEIIHNLAKILVDPDSSMDSRYEIDEALSFYDTTGNAEETWERYYALEAAAKKLLFIIIGRHGIHDEESSKRVINYAIERIEKELLEPNLNSGVNEQEEYIWQSEN